MNNLEIFNPDLSVSTQGLVVNNFVVNPKTNDIYFSGESDGINIWRLDYSNKSSFIKNRCDKVCLTKGGLSSVLPNKLTGFGFSSNTSGTDNSTANTPECITQLEIDGERNILYSLSNRSVIRVYRLQPKQEHLTEGSTLTPNQIFKSASSAFVDTSNFKVFERFKIINITKISQEESSSIQLIAVTSNGCRILLKLGTTSTFSSLLTSSFASSHALNLNLVNIKFPPTRKYQRSIPNLIVSQETDNICLNLLPINKSHYYLRIQSLLKSSAQVFSFVLRKPKDRINCLLPPLIMVI